MDETRSRAGSQHDRDAVGKLAEQGRDGGGDVPRAEGRYNQAVNVLGHCFDPRAVVAEGDGCQAGSGASLG